MTQSGVAVGDRERGAVVRCGWCGRAVPRRDGPGRPAKFCRQSCRQRAYESRQRAHDVGLAEGELIVARQRLDELGDALYVLQCAIEDVDRDLATAANDPAEVRLALEWLLRSARPVAEFRL